MLCCECLKTYPEVAEASEGMCSVHPDEPLLDLRDEEVRRFLREDDARRRHRHYARWLVGLGVPISLAGCGIEAWLGLDLDGFLFRFSLLGSISLAGFIAKKTFRSRYRRWTRRRSRSS